MIKTKIIKINPQLIELDKMEIITDVLNGEGLIVYPTETFYGIGVKFSSREACQKIYSLKQRGFSKPLSVVISDLDMLGRLVSDIPPFFEPLSNAFWPGPLTLIFRISPYISNEYLSALGTIGVRLPGHSWLRELVRLANFPITASSANLSGEKEISQPEQIIKIFHGKVDIIVDGGETEGTLPSTVVDLTAESPKIVREGAVPSSKLMRYLKN